MDRDIFNHSDRPFSAFQISPLGAVRSTSGMNVTVPAIQPQGSRFGDFWAARDGALSAGDFDFGTSLLMVVSPLLSQPLEQRRDMHLIGLVVAGERVHHVLTKTFFLLRDFPGRFTTGQLWVEALPAETEEETNRPARAGDGVSSILITSNDLAGAWAIRPDGQPVLPLVPA